MDSLLYKSPFYQVVAVLSLPPFLLSGPLPLALPSTPAQGDVPVARSAIWSCFQMATAFSTRSKASLVSTHAPYCYAFMLSFDGFFLVCIFFTPGPAGSSGPPRLSRATWSQGKKDTDVHGIACSTRVL